ncbi:4Fe-4S dicluster domain-containing protein [Lentisphaera profundi]|uniref:4Fe-4S dicluster domain-containing protein n=1 Tax=Lentisphaera profundi TaxID=1658616 RepID=A0ABY7VWJ5_9BACT|nr:4Fe-4S dicluster domain-containing protein [Lentisphaera profundi]WDE98462.1 4Fe-4S dicluster domain-containing protein [Lentisphaera profundi]
MKRSKLEMIFLVLFLPAIIFIYTMKSYPAVITNALGINDPFGDFFFFFGKSPNFWYQTLYTGIVVIISAMLLFKGKSPYGKRAGKASLSSYQKKKFTSILLVQLVGFYFMPFVLPMINGGDWSDKAPKNDIVLEAPANTISLDNPINYSPDNQKYSLLVYVEGILQDKNSYEIINDERPGTSVYAKTLVFDEALPADQKITVSAFHLVHKMAHVYVAPAFFSSYALIYMFVIIPIFVWFFGKRYCSWVCACGNLAETIGTTKWGAKWVREGTPRGEKSLALEWIQVFMFIFSIVIGISIILNTYHIISPGAYDRLWHVQDLIIDFTFGSIIGVGLYPFFGTRIWCRYGCPMARWMKLFGRWTRSRYAVVPNDNCKGIGLCTQACPMGIAVDEYAHKDKKPIEVSFGLHSSPCIGCGGCIDACPVDALTFNKIGDKTVITTKVPGEF